MEKDKTIELITGRIIDEYRKHPELNWSLIAAQKIYSQWNEYYNQQTKALTDEVEKFKSELKFAKSQNRNYLSFLKQRNELKNENIQLQSRISELEKALESLREPFSDEFITDVLNNNPKTN